MQRMGRGRLATLPSESSLPGLGWPWTSLLCPSGEGGVVCCFAPWGFPPFLTSPPTPSPPSKIKTGSTGLGACAGSSVLCAATGMVIGASRVGLGLARAQQTLGQASKCLLLLLLRRCEAQVVAVELEGLEK